MTAESLQSTIGTKLNDACSDQPQSIDTIRSLVTACPDAIKAADSDGNFPLHLACKNKAPLLEVIRYLVEQWPEAVTRVNNNGRLPLHSACRCAAPLKVVQYLVEQRSQSVKMEDSDGKTPLDYARRPRFLWAKKPEVVSWLQAVDIIGTQLRQACSDQHQSIDSIMSLVGACPDAIKAADSDGSLPLHLACKNKAPLLEVIRYLVEQWPEAVTRVNNNGRLPLHSACRCAAPLEVVQYLVEQRPPSVKMEDSDGKTPLDYARRPRFLWAKKPEVVSWLQAVDTGRITFEISPTPQPASTTSEPESQPASTASTPEPSSIPPARPGAYLITTTESEMTMQICDVVIPENVRPGQSFIYRVEDDESAYTIQCPRNTSPGDILQVELPVPSGPIKILVELPSMAILTAASEEAISGGAHTMADEIQMVNQQVAETRAEGASQICAVRIPPNVGPGIQFHAVDITNSDQSFELTCPDDASPNDWIVVEPSAWQEVQGDSATWDFHVEIPPDAQAGESFYATIQGQGVLVPCPTDVTAGETVLCQLPIREVVGNIQLAYKSQGGGWHRTINLSDMKFQWVRTPCTDMGNDGIIVGNSNSVFDNTFDFTTSAYVRQITYLHGNDARMRTGSLEWVPANEAIMESRLSVENNRTLLSCADIVSNQGHPLDVKTAWFQEICSKLTPSWSSGYIHMVVRREHLLDDSKAAVMRLGMADLRKPWQMEFLGEPAVDEGGVAREWFELVTEQLFDPNFGLWLSSSNNQLCCNINAASGTACPDDHLIYFRFLGRVLGRALFDRQLVKGRMVHFLYKHLLGWPISFVDLQAQDGAYYESLKSLTKMEDVSLLSLTFTATEANVGTHIEVELGEGGAMRELTNENLVQYMEANLRYKMLDRIKLQLTELLLGFFDVVPASALTVFDANELELILCGLPEIDMADWQAHTNYSGIYQDSGSDAQVVEWFWQVVEMDFDQEMKARLLQFVTGSSGVPSGGFSVLQGVDGNIKKFTIHGVDGGSFVLPRAHTCFNRIDLPRYSTKKDLYDRLKTSVTMCSVGFGDV